EVLGSDGVLIDHLIYDSYGNVISQSNPSAAPRFGYTGMQVDSESGLLFDFRRYYDPKDGRFISQDPKGFAAGDNNLYRYVTNNPTNRVDPTGLQDPFDVRSGIPIGITQGDNPNRFLGGIAGGFI